MDNPQAHVWAQGCHQKGGVKNANTSIFVAGAAGFEPAHAGVKVLSLTAWLYPNVLREGKVSLNFAKAWLQQERKEKYMKHEHLPVTCIMWCREWDLNPHGIATKGF